jgi:pimeloyl-ACP methyl ester carboxylesterase
MQCARYFVGALTLFVVLAGPVPALAQPPIPTECAPGVLPSTALSLICVPSAWNRQVVVFAPGYTPPYLPKGFYYLTTPDGAVSLPELVMSLGYAFATTSYRRTGLVILDGADDVRQLVARFKFLHPTTSRVHVTGVSEGGLVATLLAEQSPDTFTTALAACAPIGSFRQQINYLGDFRALFDYFFPGVLPGSPVSMPDGIGPLFDFGDPTATPPIPPLKDRIAAAMMANPSKALELMRVSRAAYDPNNLLTVIASAVNILRYNVVGLDNAQEVLNGNPYGNRGRLYFGSSNDLRLNLLIRRYDPAPAALAAMQPYETDGDLSIPLVTIHTTADEIAPFAHELLYLPKVDTSGRGLFLPVPIARYGHCNFTPTEIGLAFLFTANLP